MSHFVGGFVLGQPHLTLLHRRLSPFFGQSLAHLLRQRYKLITDAVTTLGLLKKTSIFVAVLKQGPPSF